MKEKIFSVLFVLLLCSTIGLTAFSCIGCNSFKKIDSGISIECDVYYTTLRTISGKEGESTIVGAVYVPCSKSMEGIRQKQKDEGCLREFFPDGNLDRDNYKQYNKYLECRQSN